MGDDEDEKEDGLDYAYGVCETCDQELKREGEGQLCPTWGASRSSIPQ